MLSLMVGFSGVDGWWLIGDDWKLCHSTDLPVFHWMGYPAPKMWDSPKIVVDTEYICVYALDWRLWSGLKFF